MKTSRTFQDQEAFILEAIAPKRNNVKRLNNLIASFQAGHFEKHVLRGRILKLDPDCEFCQPYLEGGSNQ